jgi:putative transposase
MKINDAGNMVLYWWGEMQNKYRNIELHERVIMPNHFHGIIEIKSGSEFVGANLRVRPNESRPNFESDKGQTHRSAPTSSSSSNPSLDTMIQWFKTMTTNGYIRGVKEHRWSRFNQKLWQRNYYEHVIRDEKSYLEISEYIQANPVKWQDDKYYVNQIQREDL